MLAHGAGTSQRRSCLQSTRRRPSLPCSGMGFRRSRRTTCSSTRSMPTTTTPRCGCTLPPPPSLSLSLSLSLSRAHARTHAHWHSHHTGQQGPFRPQGTVRHVDGHPGRHHEQLGLWYVCVCVGRCVGWCMHLLIRIRSMHTHTRTHSLSLSHTQTHTHTHTHTLAHRPEGSDGLPSGHNAGRALAQEASHGAL